MFTFKNPTDHAVRVDSEYGTHSVVFGPGESMEVIDELRAACAGANLVDVTKKAKAKPEQAPEQAPTEG